MADANRSDKRSVQKGFSLVELIVAVAILSVLLGLMANNIDALNGYRARKCKNLLANSISELKVKTLSKAVNNGDIYMVVYKDGKKIYRKTYVNGTPEDAVEIGARIGIRYGGNSITTTEIGDEATGALTICFNRSTGAMLSSPSPTAGLSQVEYIECYSSANKVYQIQLIPATGKVINRTR
ncbi:MAG: prepilin-type N-terminal cleavage/methylation domain-containing protein [Lachnospiraceae bacterium]|nr:prepilin-type N-terminal cleavage/methylation domain-containing protein [Lachnospiraceae bacterium]